MAIRGVNVVRIELDLEALERLIMRNCQNALTEFGFELESDSPSLFFSFVHDQDNNCVGLELTQTFAGEEPPA